MMVSYRTHGAAGTMSLPRINDLQIAFNRVVAYLQSEGYLTGCDIGKQVRIEGKIKIDKKRYNAVAQGGLVVVENGPKIPDRIEVKC